MDLIGDFDVAEERTDKGWLCKLDDPEEPGERQYWPTREHLWIEHCFERFLEWCHSELAEVRWLELYFRGGTTAAMLRKDRPETNQEWDSLEEFVSNLVPVGTTRIVKPATKARNIFVPIRKQLDAA